MAEKYTKEMTVGTSLCGADGKLSLSSAFALFQDIASEHARQMGLGFAQMKEKQAFWVTVRTRVRFYRRPELLDAVELETWPLAPGKVRCDRCYRMREKGEICIEGKTEWCVVNTSTGGACALEGVFAPDIAYSDERLLHEPYARFRHDFSDEDKVCGYTVRTGDIDLGRHMNNVAYLRLLTDSFSVAELEGMNVSEMEIMFLSSCYEGDELDIMRRKTDYGYEFGVRRNDGRYGALALIKAE